MADLHFPLFCRTDRTRRSQPSGFVEEEEITSKGWSFCPLLVWNRFRRRAVNREGFPAAVETVEQVARLKWTQEEERMQKLLSWPRHSS